MIEPHPAIDQLMIDHAKKELAQVSYRGKPILELAHDELYVALWRCLELQKTMRENHEHEREMLRSLATARRSW